MDLYEKILEVAKRRGIFFPSFDIYGGLAGFYDYGPYGSLLKDNILEVWKKFYIAREGFLLVDTPNIMPYQILKASGHVDRFTDILVECKNCGSKFRADKLLEELGIKYSSKEEIFKIFSSGKVSCPLCGELLSDPKEVNLMFRTEVGFGEKTAAFLRPETAQGIFIDFPLLYNFARKKLPMGVAQIGKGFRNEISPRQGIIRLREFNMAEVEVFFDPDADDHPKFEEVKEEKILAVKKDGKEVKAKIGELLERGIIRGKMLAYYIGLTKKILCSLGISEEKLRFRQHRDEELAHYAKDCWDAEVYLERFGWTEIVGIANRSSYDLEAHSKATGREIKAFRNLQRPKKVKIKRYSLDMKMAGPKLRGKAKEASRLVEEGKFRVEGEELVIEGEGGEMRLPREALIVEEEEKFVMVEPFTPWVIEPSYGIDRILYAVLEHSYAEDDRGYPFFRLKPYLAPIKAGVFPIVNKEPFTGIAKEIYQKLVDRGIVAFYDANDSIGRRYARMDEIGTPYCITVDGRTPEDGTVTVRDRDTRKQIRVDKEEAISYVEERTKFKLEEAL